jgi:hypothetical protein
MLAKPTVSELALCSIRQILEDYCLVFEALNDWPLYKRDYFKVLTYQCLKLES